MSISISRNGRLRARMRDVVRSSSVPDAARKLDVILDDKLSDAQVDSIIEKQTGGKSKLDVRRTDSDQVYAMLYSGLRAWYAQNSEKVPTYDDPSRDLYLSDIWRKEPILAGAVYSMTAKMTALRWSITGKRAKARNLAKVVSEAAHFDGYTWDGFISSTATDFYTTNRGAFWETPRIGDYRFGKIAELGHIDALACTLTGNRDYPMYYASELTGQSLRFRVGEYIHFASMPSPRERHLGAGFCAVDRALRAVKLLMALHDYDEEKLNNLPPEGVASVSGLTMEEFMDALQLWKTQRQADKSLTFPQVLWLIGSEPGTQVSVDIQGFSSLPESFDREQVVSHYISTLALDFGVDAREFWPISSGSLGTASESEIQHLKAKGKGPGEFISIIERHINGEADEDTHFAFDTQDIEEDMQSATIAKAWIDAFYPLYTGTPAGKSKASPGGKPNTNMVPDEEEIPKDSAANERRGQVGQMTQPGVPGQSGPEQIISKDQILRLLADRGVLPEWMMDDNRVRVEDTSIHVSKELDDNEYTSFVWEAGVLKERRLPAIILTSAKAETQDLPYAGVDYSTQKDYTVLTVVTKGGKGSGHFGHVGRPGKQGGALPGKGGGGAYAGLKGDDGKPIKVGDIVMMGFEGVGKVGDPNDYGDDIGKGKVYIIGADGDDYIYDASDLSQAMSSTPTKFVNSYDEVGESEFGKGYMILGDDSLADISGEFGGGTNDHVGFATAAENASKFGLSEDDIIQFLNAYVSMEDVEPITAGWQKIYDSGAVRVREFGSEVSIQTRSLNKQTLRRLQRLYDAGKLGIGPTSRITWESFEGEFLHSDAETLLSAKHVTPEGLKELSFKTQKDAPYYRYAPGNHKCMNCRFFRRYPNRCDRFDFKADEDYVCDAWESRGFKQIGIDKSNGNDETAVSIVEDGKVVDVLHGKDAESYLTYRELFNAGELRKRGQREAKAVQLLKQREMEIFEERRNIHGEPIPEREATRGARITKNTLRDELERWRQHPILSKYAPTEEEIQAKLDEAAA